MKTLVLASLCLPLAACGPPEGYFRDNAIRSYRANQECSRMWDSRSGCADDVMAAAAREVRPMWSD